MPRLKTIVCLLFFPSVVVALMMGRLPERSLPSNKKDGIPKVEIVGGPGTWKILKNGQPYFIKGVCGRGNFGKVAEIGGNTIRTYGSDSASRIQMAKENGLGVVYGLWLKHERHGLSYADALAVKKQRERILSDVRAQLENPNILMWAVGNEMEGDGGNPAIWKEINEIACQIKAIDARPVLTVVAGASEKKLRALKEYCPDLDLVGINAYGSLAMVHQKVVNYLPDKPYLITEYGARGAWESAKTQWKAPLEQTSTEKAEMIHEGAVRYVSGYPGHCLGGFVFSWTPKQEATHTWFGLHLDDGSPTASVDALQHAWTGKWPIDRAPEVKPLVISGLNTPLRPGQEVPLSVDAHSLGGGALFYQWTLYEESRDRKTGGDREARPPQVEGALSGADSKSGTLVAPGVGQYRLFITIKDEAGRAATANQPFVVK